MIKHAVSRYGVGTLVAVFAVALILPACHGVMQDKSAATRRASVFKAAPEPSKALPYPGSADRDYWLTEATSAERCATLKSLVEDFVTHYVRGKRQLAFNLEQGACSVAGEDGSMTLPFKVERHQHSLAFMAKVQFAREDAANGQQRFWSQGNVVAVNEAGSEVEWQPQRAPHLLHSKLSHLAASLSAWMTYERRIYALEGCQKLGRFFMPTTQRCVNQADAHLALIASLPSLADYPSNRERIAGLKKFVALNLVPLAQPAGDEHKGQFAPLKLKSSKAPLEAKRREQVKGQRSKNQEAWLYEWTQVIGRDGEDASDLTLKLVFTWTTHKLSKRLLNTSLTILHHVPQTAEAADGFQPFEPQKQTDLNILHPAVLGYHATLLQWGNRKHHLTPAKKQSGGGAGKKHDPKSDGGADGEGRELDHSKVLTAFVDLYDGSAINGFAAHGLRLYSLVVRACHQGVWNNPELTCPDWYRTWRDKDVDASDFSRASFKGMRLEAVRWLEVNLEDTDWTDTEFGGEVRFSAAVNLKGAVFASDLTHVVFADGVDLTGVTFKKIFAPGNTDVKRLATIFGAAGQLDKATFELAGADPAVVAEVERLQHEAATKAEAKAEAKAATSEKA